MSEYSKTGADVVNYRGRLIHTPTQAPEGWGSQGAGMMWINRPIFMVGDAYDLVCANWVYYRRFVWYYYRRFNLLQKG